MKYIEMNRRQEAYMVVVFEKSSLIAHIFSVKLGGADVVVFLRSERVYNIHLG